MEHVITYTTPHLIYWDWRIAADLFCGGVGVGAFTVAATAILAGRKREDAVVRAGAALAPVLILVGIALLMTELGQPARIWRTVTGFNPSSPLAWGGPLQGIMILIGAAFAYGTFRKDGDEKLPRKLAFAGLPVAILVAGYHGWLLSVVAARALWNSGFATLTALTGMLATGMAAVIVVLVVSRLLGGQPDGKAERHLLTWLLAVILVQALIMLLWYAELRLGSDAKQAALAAAGRIAGGPFGLPVVLLGIVVPGILAAWALLKEAKDRTRVSTLPALAAGIVVLAGSFLFRFALVVGGQLS